MTISLRSPRSIALHIVCLWLAAQSISTAQQKPPAVKPLLTVYKTATCGCCAKWVDHMRANGFDATVQDLPDLGAVKAKLGVPPELGSCHTAQVGRYVIEGHIPADVVQRLLKDRPTTVAGLAVPGMPLGSPGMEVEGQPAEPFDVIAFAPDGSRFVFMEVRP